MTFVSLFLPVRFGYVECRHTFCMYYVTLIQINCNKLISKQVSYLSHVLGFCYLYDDNNHVLPLQLNY